MIKLKDLLSKDILKITKNSFKGLLREAILRGEWWISDGQSIFANGDVGETNHEMYAADILKRQILDELGIDSSYYEYVPDLNDIEDEIYKEIQDELTDQEKQLWQENIVEAIISYLQRRGDANIKEKTSYAFGNKDAREYALEHLHWQRVKGNVIQTQTLTRDDLKNIVNGLYDAYGDEVEQEGVTFNMEVMATRSWYTEIPMSVLETLNPSDLNQYRSRY